MLSFNFIREDEEEFEKIARDPVNEPQFTENDDDFDAFWNIETEE